MHKMDDLANIPGIFKSGYGSPFVALVLTAIAYINLTFSYLIWVALAVIAFRYLYSLMTKENARDVIQDFMQYTVILAVSSFLQNQNADFPTLVHGIVAALLLHELRLLIPIMTSILIRSGQTSQLAAQEAQSLETAIEAKFNPLKYIGTGSGKQ